MPPKESSVTLRVPQGWALPTFFSNASASEVAWGLQIAALAVPILVEKGELAKHDTERNVAIEQMIRSMRLELRSEYETQIAKSNAIQVDADRLREELVRTKAELLAAQRQVGDAAAQGKAEAALEWTAKIDGYRHETEARLGDHLKSTIQHAADMKDERDQQTAKANALQEKVDALSQENARLKTPSGRGESGEADVASIVAELGYKCHDTSRHKEKERFGDLLVVDETAMAPNEGSESDGSMSSRGTRIAIEIKNRQHVRQSEVDAFSEKVRRGVASGLYDGGIMISLRAPFPGQSSCARQALLEIEGKQTVAPMAWLSCERTKPVQPLSSDYVAVILRSHMELCAGVQEIFVAAHGDQAEQMAFLKEQFSASSQLVTELFAEFGRHQSTLDALRKSLDTMKQKAIAFHRMTRRALLAQMPVLGRVVTQLPFERSMDHAVKLAAQGKLVWNNVTGRDAILSTLGKECAQTCVSEELVLMSKESKRQKVGPDTTPDVEEN